jgi:hypothetical protein
MSQEDYNKKYLKYKAKYFALKNQKGGVVCPKCGKEPCECLPFINIEILLHQILQNFNPPYKGVISLAAIPQFRITIKENLKEIIDTLKSTEPLFATLVDNDWDKFLNLCNLLVFQDTIVVLPLNKINKYNRLENEHKLLVLELISLDTSVYTMHDAIDSDIETLKKIIELVRVHKFSSFMAFNALKNKWSIIEINRYKEIFNKVSHLQRNDNQILAYDMFDLKLDDTEIAKIMENLRLNPDISTRDLLENYFKTRN